MSIFHTPTRRGLLLSSGVLFAWAHMPKAALAEGRDPRLLAIVLRGALDGLATVAPVGDPAWVPLRGDKGLSLAGSAPALPLGNFFALNPAMPNLHAMYQGKQALIVHAVATPYRERSHFDGQDVLESGLTTPGAADSGWLNRAPRVGALSFDGWDTHADEGATNGRLATLLGALDGALGAIQSGMGDTWRNTVVVVTTEFGRTARINGTNGTDHGTATVALLAGGAVKGGRVVADWPGVTGANLYEGRDLKPTTDLRAVLKGVLRDHLLVGERRLAADVFPDSNGARCLSGLV
jgi:uncharacterized protein (DUF1501 family)